MKIGIFGIKTYPAFYGADRVVENLLKYYNKSNHFTIYLTTVDNKERLKPIENLNFVYIPTINNKYLKAPIFFLLSSLHAVFFENFDVLHIHNSDFGIFSIILKIKYSRVIGTFHGHAYLRDKWGKIAKLFLKLSEKIFIKNCRILTTVSKSTILSKSSNGKSFIYIPNGIDKYEEISEKCNFLKNFMLEPKQYILFVAGRIDRTKGLHLLIRAFRGVDTDLKLLIIGDFSHDLMYSNEIFREASKDKRIFIYNGLLKKSELLFIIKNSKIFVFPSEIEAMSMILLEAISLGVPILCSDIKENMEILGYDYPYKFKSGEYLSLQYKLQDMLISELPLDFFNGLSEKIVQKYNWANIAREYESLYNELYHS